MNKHRLPKLLAAARNEVCPPPPADFVADTLRLARQQVLAPARSQGSVNGQLNSLFSPVSLACVSLIILAFVVDWGLTEAGFPQPYDNLSQATAQLFDNSDQM